MPSDILQKISALGLRNNELRFIKIMLGFTSHATSSRSAGRYEWTDDPMAADIVIVDVDNDDALGQWQQISCMRPSAILLLVTETDSTPYAQYSCKRPFGPAKILELLDRIVSETQLASHETAVFTGMSVPDNQNQDLTTSTIIPVRIRALVVDDSPTVRKKLVLELGNFNIKVDTAESGELALEMLREQEYDIVFLDIMLPGMDGYQICKSIRKVPDYRDIPIIMLSSKSSRFDKVRGSLAGCNFYLTKPVEYGEFYQVLENYLLLPHGRSLKKHA